MANGEYQPDSSKIKERMTSLGMVDSSGEIDIKKLIEKIKEVSGFTFTEQSVRNWIFHGKGIHKKNLEFLGQALEIGEYDLISDAPQDAPSKPENFCMEFLSFGFRKPSQMDKIFKFFKTMGAALRYIHWGKPKHGFLKEFSFDEENVHQYAEVEIHPMEIGSQVFTFTFRLKPFYIDYGKIFVKDKTAYLLELFTQRLDECKLTNGSSIKVWNWFGKDPCTFYVQSNADFKMGPPVLMDKRCDPNKRGFYERNPDVLVFRRSIVHVMDAGEKPLEDLMKDDDVGRQEKRKN